MHFKNISFRRMLRHLTLLSVGFLVLSCGLPAFAQIIEAVPPEVPAEVVAPSDDLGIPFVGQIVAVIVSIFSLVSAIIPARSMPEIVTRIVNFLALNFLNARNDPNIGNPR